VNHLPLFKGSLSQAEKVLRGLFERIYILKFNRAIDCLSFRGGALPEKSGTCLFETISVWAVLEACGNFLLFKGTDSGDCLKRAAPIYI
jgi:hypothetical protein